jgi:X-X-X-Leu-X-X-Gly heptad repeat protein
MTVLATMRRLFMGPPPVERTPAPKPPEPAAVANALMAMADHLRAEEADRRAILAVLERLPASLQSLPEMARQQARLGEALTTALVQQRARDQTIEDMLRRIAEGVGHQVDTFGLVQQQLDLNHQAAQRVADGVTSLSGGIGELATGQRRNADALESILQQAREREEALERIQGRLHLWLLAATGVAGGSLLACLLLAWALMTRSSG